MRQGQYAGFCSGVREALEAVLRETDGGKRVATLGPLVHNEAVDRFLQERGVARVEKPEEAAAATLIIRTHGVPPSLEKRAAASCPRVVDATCPRVRRLHRLAERLAGEGVTLVLFGDPGHPEVEGIAARSGEGGAMVISSPEGLRSLNLRKPVALAAQTTADPPAFRRVKEEFSALFPGERVYETLCREAGLRQEEALRLAEEVEAMVVVGSASSANTAALARLCGSVRPTCRVADAGELDPRFLERYRSFGVTAGASTPHWTIKEVVERMEKENFAGVENEEQFEYQESIKSFAVGEQVTGQVVSATDDEVLLDIGYKSEALLPRSEVYVSEGETMAAQYPLGTEIEVTVIEADDQEGKVVVSHKRLSREKRWSTLEEALQNQRTVEGKVKQVVPAGMVVDLGDGLEGFMPGSLVDLRYIPDFKSFLHQTISFKIIEINREKDKVILSRKKLLEDQSTEKKSKTLDSLEVGSIIKGVVRRLTDFGAFVDVGGLDGLVHISELAWERVGHPSEVLKVGQEIDVKVLEVIKERERISLSLKQAQPDPWDQAEDRLKTGTVVKGKVTRILNFGAFVELKPGLEGLVHISQMADYHVKHPSEVLREGEEVEVKILELRPREKRISLSIREARGKTVQRAETPAAAEPEATGNVTLGDVFGALFNGQANGGAQEDESQPAPPAPGLEPEGPGAEDEKDGRG